MTLKLIKGSKQVRQEESRSCTALVLIRDEFKLEKVIEQACEIRRQDELYLNTPIELKETNVKREVDEDDEKYNPGHRKIKYPPHVDIEIIPSDIDKTAVFVRYSCGPSSFNECRLGEECLRCWGTGNLKWELKHKHNPLYLAIKNRIAKIAAAGLIASISGYQLFFKS